MDRPPLWSLYLKEGTACHEREQNRKCQQEALIHPRSCLSNWDLLPHIFGLALVILVIWRTGRPVDHMCLTQKVYHASLELPLLLYYYFERLAPLGQVLVVPIAAVACPTPWVCESSGLQAAPHWLYLRSFTGLHLPVSRHCGCCSLFPAVIWPLSGSNQNFLACKT